MQPTGRPSYFRQTPPALFPPILGLFGLGLAWRNATGAFPVPAWAGELILGAVTLVYLHAFAAYLAKVARGPGTFRKDLTILAGRAGLSAGTGAGMLLAAALVPYADRVAVFVLTAAVGLHAAVALMTIAVFRASPPEQRRITPVWHLTFVGFIIAPVAAIPLGAVASSQVILLLCLPVALVIWAGHLWLTRRHPVPPPLRPLLAIHLSPLCLFGIAAALMQLKGIAAAFGWLAILTLAVFLVRLPYLLRAGFSPLWGAFTFPLAAFTNLMLLLATLGEPFRSLGGVALIAATLTIPVIAFRVFRLWAGGRLGALTNAARA